MVPTSSSLFSHKERLNVAGFHPTSNSLWQGLIAGIKALLCTVQSLKRIVPKFTSSTPTTFSQA